MASRYVGTLYLFFVTIIGVIFGTVYVQMLPHALMSDLLEQWGAIFTYSYQVASSWETFQSFFLYHIRFFVCMLVVGLTIVGYPITMLIHFLKAFLIGTTLQLFLSIWENEGLTYFAIWILPSALFIISALIILTSALAQYSYDWYKLIKHQNNVLPLIRLCKLSLICLILILIAALAHTYVSPFLFTYFIN